MRRHPVIVGMLLLLLVGVVFFLFVYGVIFVGGDLSVLARGDKIGVVNIEGVITDSQAAVEQLDEFGRNDRIKAVVLRIDSPGGGVAPSQEIYGTVVELRKKKKVVASMGSVAASGGYLIACAADKIVANPGTITGSISAVMHFANVEELLRKIGLKTSVVKSGKYKDIGSPARAMTEEEKILIQGLVDDIYEQFLAVIIRERKISPAKLRGIADGRVFSGRQAQKLGLVDFLGDRSYAIRLAGKMSGIEGEPDVVSSKKNKITFWEFILQEMASFFLSAGRGKEAGSYAYGVDYM